MICSLPFRSVTVWDYYRKIQRSRHHVKNRLYSISACRSARELIFFVSILFRLAQSRNVIVFVFAWCHEVTTSQNSFILCQLVDVLKWWYTYSNVDISVNEFQATIMYVRAWCLHAIKWRHDFTKITTSRQETNCFHFSLQMCSRADFIFVFLISLVAKLNLIILASILYVHNYVVTSQSDAMTSRHDYNMTSQNSLHLY